MRKNNLCGKKTIALFSVITVLCVAMFVSLPVQAAEKEEEQMSDIESLLSGIEDKVSDALSDMDEETVLEVFDYLKEKVSDGSFETKEGIKSVIEEGEEQFGFTIEEDDAQQIVDVMEKLEALGFSGEDIIEKAEGLYETYGADFVAHAGEAFSEVVEEAVTTAVKGFFKNLWEGVQSSVQNFFKNF